MEAVSGLPACAFHRPCEVEAKASAGGGEVALKRVVIIRHVSGERMNEQTDAGDQQDKAENPPRLGTRNAGQNQLALGDAALPPPTSRGLCFWRCPPQAQRCPTPSFPPQTVLFWTCEKYPHTKDWRAFGRGFLRLARRLHKCVSERLLKHFFVRGSNLLQHASAAELDAVAQKLAFFLQDPCSACPEAVPAGPRALHAG